MSDERLDTLARELSDARSVLDEAKAKKTAAEKKYRDIERDFWTAAADTGMTTVTLELGEGYGKIQFQRRETIRGIVKDYDTAVATLKEMGLDDALLGGPKVEQQALNEHMRSWLDSGQPIPEGLDFNPSRYIAITRK